MSGGVSQSKCAVAITRAEIARINGEIGEKCIDRVLNDNVVYKHTIKPRSRCISSADGRVCCENECYYHGIPSIGGNIENLPFPASSGTTPTGYAVSFAVKGKTIHASARISWGRLYNLERRATISGNPDIKTIPAIVNPVHCGRLNVHVEHETKLNGTGVSRWDIKLSAYQILKPPVAVTVNGIYPAPPIPAVVRGSRMSVNSYRIASYVPEFLVENPASGVPVVIEVFEKQCIYLTPHCTSKNQRKNKRKPLKHARPPFSDYSRLISVGKINKSRKYEIYLAISYFFQSFLVKFFNGSNQKSYEIYEVVEMKYAVVGVYVSRGDRNSKCRHP